MKPNEDMKMKMLTLRHFLFYMGLACLGGAIVGAVSNLMDWSAELVYAVGIPIALVIGFMSIQEGLFAPTRRLADSGPTPRPFLSYVGIACMAAAVLWSIFQVLNGSYGISVAVLILTGLVVATPGLRQDLLAPSQRAKAARRDRRHA